MNPKKFHLSHKKDYSDGKYSVHSFLGDGQGFKRITCDLDSICIIPFDTDDEGKIRNVYLAKHQDHLTDGHVLTCLNDSFDLDKYESYYDAVENCLKDEVGLTEIDVNDVYYLGNIQHTLPFSKEYRCYAVDLSNSAQDLNGFSIIPQDFSTGARVRGLEKVKFNRVTKGEIPDTLALSCCLLLLSYLSE
jgi:hypothetical protein